MYFFSVLPVEGAEVQGSGSKELRRTLEETEKELGGEKGKRMSLERECVVYQSQLEVGIMAKP